MYWRDDLPWPFWTQAPSTLAHFIFPPSIPLKYCLLSHPLTGSGPWRPARSHERLVGNQWGVSSLAVPHGPSGIRLQATGCWALLTACPFCDEGFLPYTKKKHLPAVAVHHRPSIAIHHPH